MQIYFAVQKLQSGETCRLEFFMFIHYGTIILLFTFCRLNARTDEEFYDSYNTNEQI